MEAKKYIVMVGDNFHFNNDDGEYNHGAYDTPEEAISACKMIIERSIKIENGATPNALYKHYRGFGESPYIIGGVAFSVQNYARAYCQKLFDEKKAGK